MEYLKELKIWAALGTDAESFIRAILDAVNAHPAIQVKQTNFEVIGSADGHALIVLILPDKDQPELEPELCAIGRNFDQYALTCWHGEDLTYESTSPADQRMLPLPNKIELALGDFQMWRDEPEQWKKTHALDMEFAVC